MQGELVGDFPETDLYDGFLHGGCCLVHSFSSSANSCNSFGHRNVSKNTLSHSGNVGASPVARSCNALVPELVKAPPEKPRVAEMDNAMEIMILKPPWLYKRAFGAAPPRNV